MNGKLSLVIAVRLFLRYCPFRYVSSVWLNFRGFKHRSDVFQTEEHPYHKDTFINTYNRLENLDKE